MFLALLSSAAAAFIFATGLFLLRLLRAETARPVAAELVMGVATALSLAAALVGFEVLQATHQTLPLFVVFIAVAVAATSLIVMRWGDFPLLGPTVSSLTAMVCIALALHRVFPTPPGPHAVGPLTIVHISATLVGYFLFVPAFILATLYCAQSWRLKTKQSTSTRLPSLVTMELMAWRLLTMGFVLFTLGIVGGFITQESSGVALRPAHVLAAIAWLVYAVALYRRYATGWSGTRAAVTVLVGFVWTSGAVLLYVLR